MLAGAGLLYLGAPELVSTRYVASEQKEASAGDTVLAETAAPAEARASHIATPDAVKALYMTSWVAGTPSLRKNIVDLIDKTEANAVVIDIKDYTGKIAFDVRDPWLASFGSVENRVPDMREFIEELHAKGIYVIGRISCFQDAHLIKSHPEWAVKTATDKTKLWGDRKGIGWLDAGSREVWDYLVAIGHESYEAGFDELNFDYIRFPSDGNMKDIYYPVSEGAHKPDVLKGFFAYLDESFEGSGAVLSADLFGMVTTNTDDLGIGQILEYALPHFDYIAPMVYPSHYPKGFNGWQDVNARPYDIIKFSLDRAVARTIASETTLALPGAQEIVLADGTASGKYAKESFPAAKIRPWLQDFNYPVTYTADMVRAQIEATYDAGLDSWMLWDPSNTYTEAALLPE